MGQIPDEDEDVLYLTEEDVLLVEDALDYNEQSAIALTDAVDPEVDDMLDDVFERTIIGPAPVAPVEPEDDGFDDRPTLPPPPEDEFDKEFLDFMQRNRYKT